MKKLYLNLTNGIEALDRDFLSENFSFIRIQSSQCESKSWMKVLEGLDYDFLMHIAIGFDVVVVDFSSRRDVPRAIFQGLEWIRYVLNRRWYNKEVVTFVRSSNTTEYFRHQYDKIFVYGQDQDKRELKSKLDYFKPYLMGKIRLRGIPLSTTNDNNKVFYRKKIIEFLKNLEDEKSIRREPKI